MLPFYQKWHFGHFFLRHSHRLAARDYYLAGRDAIFCRPFCRFLFISPSWNESRSMFTVHLRSPSITCAECATLPSDLVPQFLANDFVISVLRTLVRLNTCSKYIRKQPTKLNYWRKEKKREIEFESWMLAFLPIKIHKDQNQNGFFKSSQNKGVLLHVKFNFSLLWLFLL